MSYSNGPRIITDGLVLCLDAANSKSYPGSGTTWTDLSGNNNNGTLTNGPTFSSSNRGSIVFDGSNDRVNIGTNSNSFSFGTSAFSIETWAYISNTSPYFKTIFSIGQYTDGILFRHQPANDSFYIANTYWHWSPTTHIPLNTWKHIVITKESTNAKIYVNGNLIFSETNAPSTVSPATPNCYIGASSHNFNEVWPGRISLFKVSKGKAFSQDEVLQNYNALKGRFGL